MSVDRNAASWTSAQLVSAVRSTARLPSSHVDWTDAALLSKASEVIWSFAGWALSLSGEGRLNFSLDRATVDAVSSPYRAGSEFFLPSQAVGDTIQNVCWVRQDGLLSTPLNLITVASEHLSDTPASKGTPTKFAMLDGRIRVYPQPDVSGLIRFNYQRRHGELVTDSATAAPVIISTADGGNGYTVFTLAGTSSFAAGDFVDLVNDQYPYRIIYADLYVGAATSSTATVFVPTAYLAAFDIANMRLVRAGQTPFVSLPLEMRAALGFKVAAHVALNYDMQLAGTLNTLAEDEMKRVLQVMNPRTKHSRAVVINPYSHVRGRMHRKTRWV